MFTVKTAAAVGIAALVIAFLVSLIGGAGFGLVLIRALLSGGVFFGLTAGVEILLKQFLPELFETGSGVTESEASIEEDGSQIDIVLDDDDDSVADEPALESVDEPGTREPIRRAEPIETGTEDRAESSDDDFIEEVAAVEEVSEEEDSDDGFSPDEGVEELPSLDNFSDTFEAFGDDIPDTTDGSPSGARDLDVDIMGEHQNVEDVARAVRTVLKKDQKG